MSYSLGSKVRLRAHFTLEDIDTDPTVIRAMVQMPSGKKTTYVYNVGADVVREAAGKYYLDVDLTKAGYWYYRWEGTGAVTAADEQSFEVRKSVLV